MGSRILEYKENLEKSLYNEKHPWTSILATLESKTGISRLYIFVGALTTIGLYMVFGYGAQLICNVIGFLYPAYCSIKALETPNKEDDTKWLTYWVVFAFFCVIEFFSGFLVSWFPFYWLIKCLFCIWCMVPVESNGSMVIYRRIIRPKFLKHQEIVDDALRDLANTATKVAADNFFKKD